MASIRSESSARDRTTAHLLLIGVTLVWGTTFSLVKAALRDCSPLLFNLLRMLLASILLLAANHRYLSGLNRKQWWLCAVAGGCLALGYELQTVGLDRTTPSTSAFLTGLVVVFVPLLSILPGLRLPGAPLPHAMAYLGAFTAFFGIVLLTGTPGTRLGSLSGMSVGEWLTLGCAIGFAVHLVGLGRAAGQVPARTLGTLQIGFAAAAMLLFLPLESHWMFHLRPVLVAALLVTSVLATAAAFTIQSWAQNHLPASHTALIFTLEPVFAWLTSMLFFGERLGERALFGAGLILLGIVFAELGPTAVSAAAILPIEP